MSNTPIKNNKSGKSSLMFHPFKMKNHRLIYNRSYLVVHSQTTLAFAIALIRATVKSIRSLIKWLFM